MSIHIQIHHCEKLNPTPPIKPDFELNKTPAIINIYKSESNLHNAVHGPYIVNICSYLPSDLTELHVDENEEDHGVFVDTEKKIHLGSASLHPFGIKEAVNNNQLTCRRFFLKFSSENPNNSPDFYNIQFEYWYVRRDYFNPADAIIVLKANVYNIINKNIGDPPEPTDRGTVGTVRIDDEEDGL